MGPTPPALTICEISLHSTYPKLPLGERFVHAPHRSTQSIVRGQSAGKIGLFRVASAFSLFFGSLIAQGQPPVAQSQAQYESYPSPGVAAVPPSGDDDPGVELMPPLSVLPDSSPSNVSPEDVTSASVGSGTNGPRLPAGGTLVSIPGELQPLLARGGVPTNVEQLRLMERQQTKVSELAASCTVSVQIGPAQGCGVIVTESGFILTAAHVAMRPQKSALVTLSSGRTVRATTLGMDRSVDAGLMKIDPNQNGGQPWPHASLGTSEDLVAGMWCIATGHPGGYDPDRSIVTRVGRILRVRDGAIETDCALIGGDSGGPLFDLSGRLIAVHSRIGNDVAENLHVPVDFYGKSWERMRQGEAWGFLPGFRPVLGVTGSPNLSQAVVEIVRAGSPAEEAGVEVGDIIEQFGDVGIGDFASLKSAVSDTMPGERVSMWLNRSGVRKRVNVEVGRAD